MRSTDGTRLPAGTSSGERSQRAMRNLRIRGGILLTGLSVFAQLYFFQPILEELSLGMDVERSSASLSVSLGMLGLATGIFASLFYADRISRKGLMVISMLASSALTLATAWLSNFTLLLAITFLKGFALSGVSAVALAYLAEEMDAKAIGYSISLYLSGNIVGGLGGRLIAIFTASWGGWAFSATTIGVLALILGLSFAWILPPSQHYRPVSIAGKVRLLRMRYFATRPFFASLYLVGAAVMSTFVSVYNYLRFTLEGEPFRLPHHLVAMVFVMYLVGIAGAVVFGRLSDRRSPEHLLQLSLGMCLVGVCMMAIPTLASVVLGLGIMTFAFFGTHTLASRLVSTQSGKRKTSATCLYWLFYYVGSAGISYLAGLAFFAWGWWSVLSINAALLLGAGLVSRRWVIRRQG